MEGVKMYVGASLVSLIGLALIIIGFLVIIFGLLTQDSTMAIYGIIILIIGFILYYGGRFYQHIAKEANTYDKILKLKQLYEEGIISEEEYEKKKKELLDRL